MKKGSWEEWLIPDFFFKKAKLFQNKELFLFLQIIYFIYF